MLWLIQVLDLESEDALVKSYVLIIEKVEAKNTLIKGIEVGSQQGEFMPANEMQLLLIQLG